MEREYSARFSRWKVRRPGFGFASHAASRRDSRTAASVCRLSGVGRRTPTGGIIPALSFRTIRSAMTGLSAAPSTSNVSSDMPPLTRRGLWQRRQVPATTPCATSTESVSTAGAVVGGESGVAGPGQTEGGCSAPAAPSALWPTTGLGRKPAVTSSRTDVRMAEASSRQPCRAPSGR